MLGLGALKTLLTRKSNRIVVLAQQTSPTLLVGIGVVGFVGTAILASRATLKVAPIFSAAKAEIDEIKRMPESENHRHGKQLARVYFSTSVDVTRLYLPSVLLGGASVACLLGSHGMMMKRNAGLLAAYKLVDETFKEYRSNVVSEYGQEVDAKFSMQSLQGVSVEEGDRAKEHKKLAAINPNGISPYARFFDESSIQWNKNREYNLMFVRAQQNYANDLLKSRGHLFLNEVYDLFGIPRTSAGQVVGWVFDKNSTHGGDNYVDFGVYDEESDVKRDFVNGYERAILLDFNVDGVVYDLI